MSKLEDIAATLQRESPNRLPSDLAILAIRLGGEDAGQFFLVNVFAEAFPFVPLQYIIRASRWHRVCNGGMSDGEFDELLKPWFANRDLNETP